MRVVVSSTGEDLDSPVSPSFGRCAYFVMVDSETMATEAVPNPAVSAAGGAGVQSAELVVRQGAEAVIGDNVGPNPMRVFGAAGIPVYRVDGGSVRQAVEALLAGNLEHLAAPTVGKDYGKGLASAPADAAPRGLGGGMGAGRAGGRGQGFGRKG